MPTKRPCKGNRYYEQSVLASLEKVFSAAGCQVSIISTTMKRAMTKAAAPISAVYET